MVYKANELLTHARHLYWLLLRGCAEESKERGIDGAVDALRYVDEALRFLVSAYPGDVPELDSHPINRAIALVGHALERAGFRLGKNLIDEHLNEIEFYLEELIGAMHRREHRSEIEYEDREHVADVCTRVVALATSLRAEMAPGRID